MVQQAYVSFVFMGKKLVKIWKQWLINYLYFAKFL